MKKLLAAGFLTTIHPGAAARAGRLFLQPAGPGAVRDFEEKFAQEIGTPRPGDFGKNPAVEPADPTPAENPAENFPADSPGSADLFEKNADPGAPDSGQNPTPDPDKNFDQTPPPDPATPDEKSPPVAAFGSGRAATAAALRALGVGPGDEVLVQAWTCLSVPAAVRAVGAEPIFVDVAAGGLAPDPADFLAKITPRTRAAILASPLGRPAPDGAALRARGVKILEDLAHRLAPPSPAADAAIWSVGRDKVISAVAGGLAWARDPELFDQIRAARDRLPDPAPGTVRRALFYAAGAPFFRQFYFFGGQKFGLGKVFFAAARAAKFFPEVLPPREKSGGAPTEEKMPGSLAWLGILALRDRKKWTRHRQNLAKIYRENLAGTRVKFFDKNDGDALRVAARVPAASRPVLKKFLARRGILGEDWYETVISPKNLDPAVAGYAAGSCPRAENLAREIVNLPNHAGISEADARAISAAVREFFGGGGGEKS